MKLFKIKLPKIKLVSIFPPRIRIVWYIGAGLNYELERMKKDVKANDSK